MCRERCIWGCCEVAVETNAGFVSCGVDGVARGHCGLDGWGVVMWWPCALSREVEDEIGGRVRRPGACGQLGRGGLVVAEASICLSCCKCCGGVHTTYSEVEVAVVKFSALQAGVQESCTCTSVSRKVFLLGGGGESR